MPVYLNRRHHSCDGPGAPGRPPDRRRALLGGGLALLLLLVAFTGTWLFVTRVPVTPHPPPTRSPATEHSATSSPLIRSWTVTPSGQPGRAGQPDQPGRAGDGTPARPFVGLQAGLDAAQPGDTIILKAGTYTGPVHSVRDGASGRPITVAAEPGALLRGADVTTERLFTITHSWIVVTGLDVGNGNKGFWLEGVKHVILRGNHVHDIGGECIRVKYLSSLVEVAGNRVGPCGLVNFDLESNRKNGEGIYLGTAPDQLSRNPTDGPDTTNQVWVHDNVVRPRAECVDIKEYALHNLVENNDCVGGVDPDGSGLSARGNDNILRANVVRDFAGKGVRLGGGIAGQGIGNQVYGNTLIATGDYGIGVMAEPQGKICGNTLRDNSSGAVNALGFAPTNRCP